MAKTIRRVDHGRVPPKPDCYEIRFRLVGYEALFPVFGLLFLAPGILVPGSLAQRLVFIACGGLFIVPYVILLASRAIVFRADHAGITLGPELPTLQFSSSFIPWADIDTVSLYRRVGLSNQRGKSPGTYIEIVLDDNEPAALWATLPRPESGSSTPLRTVNSGDGRDGQQPDPERCLTEPAPSASSRARRACKGGLISLAGEHHGLGQVASQARPGAGERGVHRRDGGERVLDGGRVAELDQAVPAPAGKVCVAADDEREPSAAGRCCT